MKKSVVNQIMLFAVCIAVGGFFWLLPPPEGVSVQGMHMFGIFIFTVLGIILRPVPIGTFAILALTIITLTKTLTFREAFSGFNHHVVWLIVVAFFISRGFIKTGLGQRVSFFVMKYMGGSPLGMGYGMVLTDLILAPAIPSVTARVGGIIYPIVNSLAKGFGSEPHSHPRKLGAYLIKTTFQASVVTSGMFLTSMAGNPLITDLAAASGVHITWGMWALAALVPGLTSLLVIPLFLYKFYPPEVKHMPNAKEFAQNKLNEMGPISTHEWIMIFAFVLLITLWIIGPYIGLSAVVAALVGLCVLLLSSVLTWEEVSQEKGAWNTLVWFSTLIMMAGALNTFGLTTWLSEFVKFHVTGYNWVVAFGILSLVYFYSHYFFASIVAHIGAMYAPFLILSIALGTPPMLAALILAYFSNLFGGLTHYACGPAPIYFGSGYVKVGSWWTFGFFLSLINIFIYFTVGGVWWKVLNLY
ncbi:anion permease [Candidatus Aerophobetes bacterium]|uniref:Anion permease n=1 Tax=Aerophobetes bacterium TaxID=2030807 RepID=A0A2A4WZ90_UNCAE|nr:MAG: anion permease [Candidatus Aerophobetes bacterium]